MSFIGTFGEGKTYKKMEGTKELKGHIATAVKALEKQLIKYGYEIDKCRSRIQVEEGKIKSWQIQISSLNAQIKSLKGE
jgi:peptidoglycan hydrolase CwlO-like protein